MANQGKVAQAKEMFDEAECSMSINSWYVADEYLHDAAMLLAGVNCQEAKDLLFSIATKRQIVNKRILERC